MNGWAAFGIAVLAFAVGFLLSSAFAMNRRHEEEADEHEQHHA